jgi:hypothetical protein
MSMHIVDDEQRCHRRVTPMRPLGSGPFYYSDRLLETHPETLLSAILQTISPLFSMSIFAKNGFPDGPLERWGEANCPGSQTVGINAERVLKSAH